MAARPFRDRAWVEAFERGRNGARFLAATHDMGIAELGILETWNHSWRWAASAAVSRY